MYTITGREASVALSDLPSPGVDAIELTADDNTLVITYTLLSSRTKAQVTFDAPLIHTFGYPGDETLDSHPLHGLLSGSFLTEVKNSGWIDDLERMNRIHERHDPETFKRDLRHFLLSFKDSTFECIATGYQVELIRPKF